jgi:hypothetical protein
MHTELVLLLENSCERLLRLFEHCKGGCFFSKYPADGSLFQLELALSNLHTLTYYRLSLLDINKANLGG